jgi:hypothetical protein
MNTALIAEYLVAVHFAPKTLTEDDYRRINRMALQLAMELPAEVWSAIVVSFQTGTWQGAWDAVDAARRHLRPGDPRNPNQIVIHHKPDAGEYEADNTAKIHAH